MPGFVLVIDDTDRLKPIVEDAVRGANVKVLTAPDFSTARRKLIQAAPNLIISAANLKADLSSDGYRFCKDLKQHSELSRIPLILISDQLSGDSIRVATDCGASGLMPWPVTASVLRTRMSPLLPELLEAIKTETTNQANTAAAQQGAQHTAEASEKLALAQRLLAQVLHNLKTSDLLRVVDLEDVPRVVSEMTRSVCGFGSQENEPQPPGKAEGDTMVDLESAFRFKE